MIHITEYILLRTAVVVWSVSGSQVLFMTLTNPQKKTQYTTTYDSTRTYYIRHRHSRQFYTYYYSTSVSLLTGLAWEEVQHRSRVPRPGPGAVGAGQPRIIIQSNNSARYSRTAASESLRIIFRGATHRPLTPLKASPPRLSRPLSVDRPDNREEGHYGGTGPWKRHKISLSCLHPVFGLGRLMVTPHQAVHYSGQ